MLSPDNNKMYLKISGTHSKASVRYIRREFQQVSGKSQFSVINKILLRYIMTLQVFQAVTLNTSAYQPHALLMRILPAEGPSILREYFRPRAHNKSHRQLGLVQIRIALQEVCGQSQIKQ